uniref:Large ribosomal subunit protein bL34m n=1 Tax=Pyxicephalus adspersus TaxID=30357 RepID=A0AAV3ASD2_PYXAD|nr:TPA: hypothetical protein GDO54_008665 [Pyxicephalus adspersus]
MNNHEIPSNTLHREKSKWRNVFLLKFHNFEKCSSTFQMQSRCTWYCHKNDWRSIAPSTKHAGERKMRMRKFGCHCSSMAVFGGLSRLLWKPSLPTVFTQQRTLSNVFRSWNLGEMPSSSLPAGNSILSRAVPSHWSLISVRTKRRGMEYQPKFLKRQRTHGWLTRISTRGGIEVILRRKLKGRKSLTV